MRALGIGAGDEVVTSTISWLASGTAISLTGAEPVFADIGDDLNIDPASAEALITPQTKAIMPVHYAGKICDMDALGAIAKRHGVAIVEDASQAFGARRNGCAAGGFGDLAAFSLNQMKLLPACGEAGVVLTDDPSYAETMRRLRYHGMVDADATDTLSFNKRIDTVQAAILLTRIERVDRTIERRRALAVRYGEALHDLVETPCESAAPNDRDAWYTYVIRTPHRDRLLRELERSGVEAKVRDRLLVPDQPVYGGKAKGSYDKAEKAVDTLLSLPIHERMTDEDADYVVACVTSFFDGSGS